ncbi:MAG: DUF3124 domain-containing protein [Bacteroidales bacterium]|nr:DUF3124 domain-containing protein [Bacteroidales bacterium]MCF8455914.1 DUF3124 domain-containing protein [Bacteroidales bacterium]
MKPKDIFLSTLLTISTFLLFYSCSNNEPVVEDKKTHPSHKYNYVSVDTSLFTYFQTDYAPVYSDIYHRDGTRRFSLTVTLSIRNTSKVDSVYILSTTYYDSYGKPIKEYVKSMILLSPLESIEFVVDEKEISGGAGANFIVEWGAINYTNQLLVQTVMIGTNGQQGISFLTDAKKVESRIK